ncbi:hypothetical protein VIGAN_04363900 [Vigna angularis var. angularis]|uniref:Uncharacterized protein n=1 Tax=Vigna angularis var. angularis TaxID=157739 RepID=A0A0S3RZL1_PHAAN|nr:hypothetical protein VIGAN_04363900 [Vigna angularis var. angularis]
MNLNKYIALHSFACHHHHHHHLIYMHFMHVIIRSHFQTINIHSLSHPPSVFLVHTHKFQPLSEISFPLH